MSGGLAVHCIRSCSSQKLRGGSIQLGGRGFKSHGVLSMSRVGSAVRSNLVCVRSLENRQGEAPSPLHSNWSCMSGVSRDCRVPTSASVLRA